MLYRTAKYLECIVEYISVGFDDGLNVVTQTTDTNFPYPSNKI